MSTRYIIIVKVMFNANEIYQLQFVDCKFLNGADNIANLTEKTF